MATKLNPCNAKRHYWTNKRDQYGKIVSQTCWTCQQTREVK